MHRSPLCITSWEKEKKDYAFWRQFDEKPSIILGCPGASPLAVLVQMPGGGPQPLGEPWLVM